ncbi:MAG: sulfite exporter TauE/SafE family protein, partial [Candidatus Neomarinimicrobiota bacterium]
MKILREMYEAYITAARAHTKWECEVAQTILSDRKRLLVLFLMAIPVILLPLASAAGLPTILGGKKAYAPAFSTTEALIISVFIGLCAGLITGCIGAGGGFVITPALMSAGVRGILAVGTDMFHIFSKAIMGTAVHKKLGNVSIGLTIAFVIGSIVGATCGGYINRTIYYANPVMSDIFISLVYVFLLGFLGIYALRDYLKLKRVATTFDAHESHQFNGAEITTTTKLALKVQSIKLSPMISFDHDITPGGRQVSAWPVCGVGFVVGLVCAIMGVGGGFLAFPLHVYVLGVSSFTTVGTNIFQI